MFLLAHDVEQPELLAARGGQVNGLCGAAVPGVLSFITGLHTGLVPVRVERLAQQPPVVAEWEDVVEVSVTTTSAPMWLSTFDDAAEVALPAGQWRARFSASGMDAGAAADTRRDGEPVIDRYLLQLWPAPPERDAVLRESSSRAAYWHSLARETPAPPPLRTADEVAAAEAAEEAARVQEELDLARGHELWTWGGQPPTDRLRAAGGRTAQLARQDRDLVDALAALDPATQRAVAVWAARTASEAAQQADDPRVAPALAALERGDPLPAPFDDDVRAWRTMFSGLSVAVVRSDTVHVDQGSKPSQEAPVLDPRAAAVDALLAAAAADPLLAAAGAIDAAASASRSRALLSEVRRVFGLAAATGPPPIPGPPRSGTRG